MRYQTFALDFDGVIADGLNECILVTWNGYYDKPLADFSLAGLAKIPDWFIERFTHCRNFAKHLGHFAVAVLDRYTPIHTQTEYEQLYLSLDPLEVESFVAKVNRYRGTVRSHQESLWLDQHTLYPGLQSFLQHLDSPLYIVSAKDRDSILKILSRAGIDLMPQHVFGEQRNKIVALKAIQAYEKLCPEQIFFLDDNIINVIDVQQAGYGAHWALWGYQAEQHWDLARQYQVPSLDLKQLSELTTSVVSCPQETAAQSFSIA